MLIANGLLREDPSPPTLEFVASGDRTEFERLGSRFLGPVIGAVEQHPLG